MTKREPWWAEKTRTVDPSACPNLSEHTPMPEGYLAFASRADEMSKTHRQIRCPGCGRWMIWVPRGKRAAATA